MRVAPVTCLKTMTKNIRSGNRVSRKNKPETNSSGRLRIFYVLTLLAMVLSLFLRVSGVKPGSAGQATPGTAARILVFHRENGSSCEDLTISAAGNAVFSNCGGVEKQYALNSTERSQVQKWIAQYSPVNYDRQEQSQTGSVTTRLYLNGRGSQQAAEAEKQQILDFAETLTARLAAQP